MGIQQLFLHKGAFSSFFLPIGVEIYGGGVYNDF